MRSALLSKATEGHQAQLLKDPRINNQFQPSALIWWKTKVFIKYFAEGRNNNKWSS